MHSLWTFRIRHPWLRSDVPGYRQLLDTVDISGKEAAIIFLPVVLAVPLSALLASTVLSD
jgi:hypothetical protein